MCGPRNWQIETERTMMRDEYRRLTYSQAQSESEKLMREALKTGRWFDLPERLVELRAVMTHTDDRQGRFKLTG